jgi:hypothetical protein
MWQIKRAPRTIIKIGSGGTVSITRFAQIRKITCSCTKVFFVSYRWPKAKRQSKSINNFSRMKSLEALSDTMADKLSTARMFCSITTNAIRMMMVSLQRL